jgi:predicted metal-dependent hydrolase
MTSQPGSTPPSRRSAIFFMSDAYDAASDAAYRLKDHGLDNDEVEELAQQIVEVMADFVAAKEARA